MPNSFKEDFTVGQTSCKYFSAQSNWKTRNLKSAKYPKKKNKTKMNQLLSWIWPMYWGKRVEKELTSSIPVSFQDRSNLSIFQRSMLGSSSHGFGLSCFPLCFIFGCCEMSPLFSCSIAQFIFSYLDNYSFAFIMKLYIKLTTSSIH